MMENEMNVTARPGGGRGKYEKRRGSMKYLWTYEELLSES